MGENLNQEGTNMIQQGILPFKLERTSEEITPRSGLVIYAEILRALGVKRLVECHMPKPLSNRGYRAWRFIEPLLLMIYGGGRHIEDLREIRDDVALREVIGLTDMPSLSTFGDWLIRMGERGGREAMEEVNKEVFRKIVAKCDEKEYTLDVDSTVIESWKEEAKWTYKKVKGYHPIAGFLKENALCIAYEFREGNVQAGSGAEEFLKKCEEALPEGKKITAIRSDSAFYQAEVINWCEESGKKYTITADKDKAVMEVIGTIKNWRRLHDKEGNPTDREIGSTIHTMNKTEKAFRLIVERWQNPQPSLFSQDKWCYHVIATNIDDWEEEEIVWFHNERCQVENLIKELKIGFSMEQMVSGNFLANSLYFALGILVYNTTQAQKLLFMGEEWHRKTIATIRWKLVEIAGKVIRHGRRVILKIVASVEKLKIFLEIRRRCLDFR